MRLRGAKYWKTKPWETRSQGPRNCCRYFRYRRYLRYFKYFRYFRYFRYIGNCGRVSRASLIFAIETANN